MTGANTGTQPDLATLLQNCNSFNKYQDHLSEPEWLQTQHLSGLPIIHEERYVCSLPPNHRFKMKKFHYLYQILLKDEVINEKKQVIRPQQISEEITCLVHTPQYTHTFFNGLTTPKEQRRTGFVWTPGLVSRVRYETGGTLLAGRLSMECGLSCSTGGGTHHAFPTHGSGYCLVNDLAVTARQLLHSGLANKVLIVDLDVHQGDGTAYIFQADPNVFTLSLHCQDNFPFHKQSSDLDVGLRVGIADHEYMKILTDTLPGILDDTQPDIILYDAGVDPHQHDQLGRLKLTDQGLYDRDLYVLKSGVCRGIPVACVIGGGYDDIHKLSARHTIIHRVATVIWNTYL